MTRLSGAAAEVRLAEAWERVFSQDPATQEIIHVLTRPAEYPAWLAGFPPFEAWMQNGCEASDEVWRIFAKAAMPWPYISDARPAISIGISSVRIFVLERAQRESAPPWLRYYQDGDVEWRAFLADSPDPDRSRKERDFMMSMRDLASKRGELVRLPPELVNIQPGQRSRSSGRSLES
jgi:hypothetical protein